MQIEINKKNINIPDKELQNLMTTLDLTEQEAINTWLCDHDYIIDEQVEALTKKAKINKTDKIVVSDKTKRKERTIEPKQNPDKEFLIDLLWQTIVGLEHTGQVKITNKTKLIEFCYHGKEFKLDLIEKRKKVAK